MSIKYNRICFIGMSGIGKSSFGNTIAKKYNLPFIDTDTLIEANIPISIQDYLKTNPEESFLNLEEKVVLEMPFPEKIIIATGGSLIYCKKAMSYLKKHCTLIYLKDSLTNIQNRTKDFNKRGIVMKGSKTIQEVYHNRLNLYEKWSDITITYPEKFSISSIIALIEKEIL
tara:strand:+ start:1687 stop:2199 length:513 start_codon:yes stop_codon:yes gene_type:complete